ncbi:MAG: low molecular weight protein-tyrosine-phosphatase [Rhodanobacteraceae bacterium]
MLFICTGNICRSPTVEAVARVEFARAGLDIEVASAGTENYHVGQQADRRAIAVAEAAGYPMSAHRARQVCAADFDRFDLLLAMDRANLRALNRSHGTAGADCVALFLEYAGIDTVELPDPYYGERRDFELALDLARRGVAVIIERLQASSAGLPTSAQH